MKIKPVFILAIIGSFIGFALADETSRHAMHIDGIKFTLGTSKAELLDMLQGTFSYQEMGQSIFLVSKNGPPFEQKGVLNIKDGKVCTIQRHFSATSDRKAFENLYQLIAVLSANGEGKASITTKEYRDKTFWNRYISLAFANRTIYLTISRGEDLNETTSVSECIGVCLPGVNQTR